MALALAAPGSSPAASTPKPCSEGDPGAPSLPCQMAGGPGTFSLLRTFPTAHWALQPSPLCCKCCFFMLGGTSTLHGVRTPWDLCFKGDPQQLEPVHLFLCSFLFIFKFLGSLLCSCCIFSRDVCSSLKRDDSQKISTRTTIQLVHYFTTSYLFYSSRIYKECLTVCYLLWEPLS